MNTVEVNDGKKIHIFDDVFDYKIRSNIYNTVTTRNFFIGWNDTGIIEKRNMAYLYSPWVMEQFKDLKFFESLPPEIIDKISGMKYERAVTNLTVPTYTFTPHNHEDQTVLLYYANMEWCPEWAGETLFYDNDLRSIPFCSIYTPNRVVLFDGEIPHALRPQSGRAPEYRFTISIFLKGKLQ
jgi:hypothetical protein